MADGLGDWMVADFPVEKRIKFVGNCKNRKEKVALWVERACEQLMQLEAGENLFPPAQVVKPAAYPGSDLTVPAGSLTVDFAGLGAMLAAQTAAYAAAGLPMPKQLVKDAGTTAKAWMRQARGLPLLPYRPRPPLLNHHAEAVNGELNG